MDGNGKLVILTNKEMEVEDKRKENVIINPLNLLPNPLPPLPEYYNPKTNKLQKLFTSMT